MYMYNSVLMVHRRFNCTNLGRYLNHISHLTISMRKHYNTFEDFGLFHKSMATSEALFWLIIEYYHYSLDNLSNLQWHYLFNIVLKAFIAGFMEEGQWLLILYKTVCILKWLWFYNVLIIYVHLFWYESSVMQRIQFWWAQCPHQWFQIGRIDLWFSI